MRLALLVNVAPRKLSSGEAWMIALCAEGRRRGHQVDLYCRTPVLAEVADRLRFERAGLFTLDSLEANPAKALSTLSGYDVVHLNLVQPRSKLALLAFAAWRARVLYVAHSDYPPDLAAGLPRKLLRRALDRVSLARAAGLAGVSDYIREKERARFGLGASCVRTLNVGVDLSRFHPRPRPAHQGLVLLGAAHLVPGKGFAHLLRALARLEAPDVRLRLAGDGPETAALVRLCTQLGLSERVEFLGLRSDLPELLAGADVFVHPTLFEAFGLAVAEAMACGLPVIASAVGGLSELIRHGETGLLVAPGDEAALAGAVEELAGNPEARLRLGRAAAASALRFDARRAAASHLDWCEQAGGRDRPHEK